MLKFVLELPKVYKIPSYVLCFFLIISNITLPFAKQFPVWHYFATVLLIALVINAIVIISKYIEYLRKEKGKKSI